LCLAKICATSDVHASDLTFSHLTFDQLCCSMPNPFLVQANFPNWPALMTVSTTPCQTVCVCDIRYCAMHITSATSFGPMCTLRNAVQPNRRNCVPYSLICTVPSGIRPFAAESASRTKPRRDLHGLRKRTAQHRIVRSEAASFTDETTKAANPLRIVFVSAEVGPWSKTGGLGDVVGGLPIALAQRGHNVLTIAPRYDV